MNFVRDVVAARPSGELAVITLDADGGRREWTFGELVGAAGALAATFADHGVERGTVVLTLVGSRIEYVLAILAGLWIGAPVLPCSEQLRPKDVVLRWPGPAPASCCVPRATGRCSMPPSRRARC